MATSRVEYIGALQTKCTHLKSGQTLITDAPVDNNGKGSAFSPTDLLATSYASCMITIIGIYCDKNDLPFTHAVADVVKTMASGPRRVSELVIEMDLTGNGWTSEQKDKVIAAAMACPVAQSVHEDMEVLFDFKVD